MWLSKRSFLLASLALAGCGFQPVLAPGSGATALTSNLDVVVQDGRENFEFRAHLLDRTGSSGGDYMLDYDLGITETVVTISSDASIERYTLLGVAEFEVKDQRTGQVVLTDTVRASSGYSATADAFPTRVAERDARLRLVQSLADQVIQVIQITTVDLDA